MQKEKLIVDLAWQLHYSNRVSKKKTMFFLFLFHYVLPGEGGIWFTAATSDTLVQGIFFFLHKPTQK